MELQDELDVPVYEQDNHLNQFYWEELEPEEINLTEALKQYKINFLIYIYYYQELINYYE